MYTTKELFEIISRKKEFISYPNHRSIKHRHKAGTLTNESYTELFNHFGYEEKPNKWTKRRKVNI